VQALPVSGRFVGQGACHVPSRQLQLDVQPSMLMQGRVCEHPPPSLQLRPRPPADTLVLVIEQPEIAALIAAAKRSAEPRTR
jgi:hypothetical protein